ncbi:MAG: CotH kinase family protein, partial [Bacteroidales bacterium]|nr:CotH kinase family protein [Bacteroidales bacterium]
ITAPPLFSLPHGFYTGQITLTISPTHPGNIIRFTSDGSDPTELSDQFTGSMNIRKTTVIRARQYQTGKMPSPVVTQTYLINEPATLPVFSITTDPANLWDEQTGIYVEGPNYVWGWGNGNFWQDWEKECYVEMFESNHKIKIDQAAALKISGGLTRTASQKSLRIIAKGTYGKPKFNYRFFNDKPIKSFNDILLRPSGNDWASTMMADGMMNTVIAGQMDIDYSAYRPAILFLNGEYWGIQNIREKIGDDYIEENHGFNKDNLDLISLMNDVREGDLTAYNELLDFVKNHDLSDPDAYAHVKSLVDIQEYINYIATEVFYANYDWPGGNIKFWRPRIQNGVWRWILKDLDLSFQLFWHNTLDWATLENPPEYPGSTDFLRGMMTSPEFRKQLLETLLRHLNTTFETNRLISVIDSLQQQIQPEINRHINRWLGYHGWTFYSDQTGYIETGWLESYDKWLVNVESLRRFARLRKGFLLQYIHDYFGLQNPVDLSFRVVPPDAGRIIIDNQLVIRDSADATYFSDQELNLRALPNPQYRFDHVEINTNPLLAGDTIKWIGKNNRWYYLDTGIFPGDNWFQPDYQITGWLEGCGILGYHDPDICTIISFGNDPTHKIITTYFRHDFEIKSSGQWSKVIIELLRDDGAVVYLNGHEVIRSNMPATSGPETLAVNAVNAPDETKYFVFEIGPEYLVDGNNTIAVEVHQADPSSSDLMFDLSIHGVVGTSNPEISTSDIPEWSQTFNSQTKITAYFNEGGQIPGLSINEVQPVNVDFYPDRLGSYSDWIEIYNPGDAAVDLAGLYLTDNPDNPGKYRISDRDPVKTIIPPKGFTVLYADGRPSLGANHIGFKLTGEGEMVGISAKTASGFEWIDTLYYPVVFPNASMGRYPDGTDHWTIFANSPTPGKTNTKSNENPTNQDVIISQNYPNPFSVQTQIGLLVKKEHNIQVWIRDIHGNSIRLL